MYVGSLFNTVRRSKGSSLNQWANLIDFLNCRKTLTHSIFKSWFSWHLINTNTIYSFFVFVFVFPKSNFLFQNLKVFLENINCWRRISSRDVFHRRTRSRLGRHFRRIWRSETSSDSSSVRRPPTLPKTI